MEDFKEENCYVETDPTGRYGRVSSKMLCFALFFPLFLVPYVNIIQVLACYFCHIIVLF
jgi:hypothetical protein